MQNVVEQAVLKMLLTELYQNIIAGTDGMAAVVILDAIEKVAGPNYRAWLMTHRVSDALNQVDNWSSQ